TVNLSYQTLYYLSTFFFLTVKAFHTLPSTTWLDCSGPCGLVRTVLRFDVVTIIKGSGFVKAFCYNNFN
ncbi:MAG: hypothetical protein ACRCUJ_07075, partial [Phocaeicola sp.]